jgi:hypothetical protein
LPDTLKEKGGEPFELWRSELRLCPAAGGGFRLEAPDGQAIQAGELREGRRDVVCPDGQRWTLRESAASDPAGFVLEVADAEGGREIARSARGSTGPGFDTLAFYLADGRVFLAAPAIGQEVGYELHGWEVRGAYWIAGRQGSGWTLRPTAAGRRLRGDRVVLVLLAAELVAAEAGSAD